LAWGVFLVYQLYHDGSADYQRAMADCIQDRNKTAAPSSGADASASAIACATSMSGGK